MNKQIRIFQEIIQIENLLMFLLGKAIMVKAVCASIIIVIMMLLIVIGIAFRAILGGVIYGITEVSTALLVVATYLGFAYVQNTERHIKLDLLTEKLSSRLVNVQTILVNTASIFMFLLIGYFGIGETIHSYQVYEHPTGVNLPIWIIRSFIPIGCFFVVLVSVFELVNGIKNFFRRS